MLDAGRELDALIALQVFHYTLDYEFADIADGPTVPALRDQYDEWGMLPHYSTDMGDAWLVVEAMCQRGWFFDLGDKPRDPDSLRGPRTWNAFIDRTTRGPDSDTAPLAICRAALLVCGVPLDSVDTPVLS